MKTQKTVFVGVSGGVDSSVSLLRLIEKGYNTVAVFIKTWQPDFIPCTWKKERLDAMRVAAHLGVPFITFDGVAAYKDRVAQYMITEYREGRTPNPDVMCNEFVKFGVFYEYALTNGADYVATGHYAQIFDRGGSHELHRGCDNEKDQSYFLWRLKREQLAHILFPIGDTQKAGVRKEAEQAILPTATKQDSQGICFLGNIDMQDFLSHYIKTEEGEVHDEQGNVIGTHNGASLYTIGQRHGFRIKSESDNSEPQYIVARNIEKNILVVSKTPKLCTGTRVTLTNINLFTHTLPENFEAQFRYRQKPFRVQLEKHENGYAILDVLDHGVDMPSVGQSCVFYDGMRCLGGGVIHEVL